MRRIIVILLVVAAACGGAASDLTDTSVGSSADEPTTSQPVSTTSVAESEDPPSTDSPDTTPAGDDADSPTADLPAAPDFTLELGTGGEYILSSTDNPVYLVFWAEW